MDSSEVWDSVILFVGYNGFLFTVSSYVGENPLLSNNFPGTVVNVTPRVTKEVVEQLLSVLVVPVRGSYYIQKGGMVHHLNMNWHLENHAILCFHVTRNHA